MNSKKFFSHAFYYIWLLMIVTSVQTSAQPRADLSNKNTYTRQYVLCLKSVSTAYLLMLLSSSP